MKHSTCLGCLYICICIPTRNEIKQAYMRRMKCIEKAQKGTYMYAGQAKRKELMRAYKVHRKSTKRYWRMQNNCSSSDRFITVQCRIFVYTHTKYT